MESSFFDEREEQSKLKSEIVVDYFVTWARIISKRADTFAYVDLFCGPGQYRTGEKSTPLLILERAVETPHLQRGLVAVFNDSNPTYTNALAEAVKRIPGLDRLKFEPVITTEEVDEGYAKHLEQMTTIPMLAFIDPWGFKGVSIRLVRSLIKDFGCECIFFFNYNRVNMGITNPLMEQNLADLFGEERLAELRGEVGSLSRFEREQRVQRAIGEAVVEMGGRYLIPFRFGWADGRTSHYIYFVTKHPLGCEIMKGIMAGKGIVDEDGVPRFEFLPGQQGQQLRFDCVRPLAKLPEELLTEFGGQTLAVREIFERHHPGTPFIMRNYKRVLRDLYESGDVVCTSKTGRIRKNSMPDHVLVSFPKLQVARRRG